ncbi:hypothetical protein KZ829_30515 [Actinoplanes hulinensis]|uniref:Uncharacterized protein n=1 Tax=Actinoplanes hulinensis TaxID=1144547 RepID=A0ABS7BAL2_9ACTN|nr:hypothetical protein [Actinoplanes hulinensis]MBW6438071.1 hypothetical protein [Actinoplanes hulinensis]
MHEAVDRIEAAWEWWSAAIDESQEGRWVRDTVERRVLADITVATRCLHGGRLPPFTDDPLRVRVGRIAAWAGVLRLAARAGGWTLSPVVGHRPPHPARMPELLSGIYAVAEWGEVWLARPETPPERAVAAAEHFLAGPGSMEDLESFFYD